MKSRLLILFAFSITLLSIGIMMFVPDTFGLNASPMLEPEPYEEQFSNEDTKRYCEYAVERNLPTPWKYKCYDEPIANPQRAMDFGNPMLGDDLLNCNDDDNKLMCFGNAFDSCTPAKINHVDSTIEGDSVYTNAYVTDDCKVHVIHDIREDKYSSLADRKIIETDCSRIEFKNNAMIIGACDDPYDFKLYSEKPNCGPETFLNDMGVCQVVEGSCLLELDGEIFWCELDKSFMDGGLIYMMILLIVGIIGGVVGGIIFVIRRKRK